MNFTPKIFALHAGQEARHTVHVIEIDEEELMFLCEFLSISGLFVTGSSDFKRGIEYVGRAHPDVLICDLSDLESGGFEVLNRARQRSPGTRVILTSDEPGHPGVEQARKGSGVDLILGTFTGVDLLLTVQRILRTELKDLPEKKPC